LALLLSNNIFNDLSIFPFFRSTLSFVGGCKYRTDFYFSKTITNFFSIIPLFYTPIKYKTNLKYTYNNIISNSLCILLTLI